MAEDKLTTLALRAGKGDEVAMDKLLPIVIIKAKGIVKQRLWYSTLEEKEDLAQDIMCRFIKSLPNFSGIAKFNTWFTRLAINTCISEYRKKTARQRQMPSDYEYNESYLPDYDTAFYCEQLIKLCTKAQQEVMWLLYKGYSLRQVAQEIELHYDAVRARQRKAGIRIRRKLRQLEHGYRTNT